MIYTTTAEILEHSDFGSKNNTSLWRCMIAAIINTKKFDEKIFEYYIKIFQIIAQKVKCNFPKIGTCINISEVFPILHEIALIYHLYIQFLQSDNTMSIIFYDKKKIGYNPIKFNSSIKNFYLCLHMNHFYIIKIDIEEFIHKIIPLTEEQMKYLQHAEKRRNYKQIALMQSEIVSNYQSMYKFN
jgi:hypothetical protein